VTNDDFAAFIAATNFETENEKFGWSFVFEGLLTEEILQNVTQAVAGAGACVCVCVDACVCVCVHVGGRRRGGARGGVVYGCAA
jgi:hypothetical protein